MTEPRTDHWAHLQAEAARQAVTEPRAQDRATPESVLSWLGKLRDNARTVNDGEGEPLALKCEAAMEVVAALAAPSTPPEKDNPYLDQPEVQAARLLRLWAGDRQRAQGKWTSQEQAAVECAIRLEQKITAESSAAITGMEQLEARMRAMATKSREQSDDPKSITADGFYSGSEALELFADDLSSLLAALRTTK